MTRVPVVRDEPQSDLGRAPGSRFAPTPTGRARHHRRPRRPRGYRGSSPPPPETARPCHRTTPGTKAAPSRTGARMVTAICRVDTRGASARRRDELIEAGAVHQDVHVADVRSRLLNLVGIRQADGHEASGTPSPSIALTTASPRLLPPPCRTTDAPRRARPSAIARPSPTSLERPGRFTLPTRY